MVWYGREMTFDLVRPLFSLLVIFYFAWNNRKQRQTIEMLRAALGTMAVVPAQIVRTLIDAGYDSDELKKLIGEVSVEVPLEFMPRRRANKTRKARDKQKALSAKKVRKDMIELAKELSCQVPTSTDASPTTSPTEPGRTSATSVGGPGS